MPRQQRRSRRSSSARPTAAQINQRCNMFVARSTALRTALENRRVRPPSAPRSPPTTSVIEVISDGQGEAGFYRQVSPSAASREAAEKCEVRMASEGTKLSLSRPIYERLKAIKTPADAATQLYLDRNLKAFERAGIALDDAGRAKAQKLGDEISTLGTEFEANIPKGQRTITATAAELDGLPQDFLDAHKPGADGKITLRTDSTDYVPVLTYAKSRDLRERFYREYQLRAYPANDTPSAGPDRQARRARQAGRPSQLRDAQFRRPDAEYAGQGSGADRRYGGSREARGGPRLCEEARGPAAAPAGRDQARTVGQWLCEPARPEAVLRLRPPGSAQILLLRQGPRRHPAADRGHVRRRHPAVEDAEMGQARRIL